MLTSAPVISLPMRGRPPERRVARHRRSTGGGFTLIELLVVIAIIAVLIGILLPSLASARSSARRIACLSNQRQISISQVGYASDFRGLVPREGSYEVSQGELQTNVPWAMAYRPYLDEREPAWPLLSPNTPGQPQDLFKSAPFFRCPDRSKSESHPLSYISNGFAFRGPGVVDTRAAQLIAFRRGVSPMERVQLPMRVVTLTELAEDPDSSLWNRWQVQARSGNFVLSQMYDAWLPQHLQPSPINVDYRLSPRRHSSGANALYFDGHATLVKADLIASFESWDDGHRAP